MTHSMLFCFHLIIFSMMIMLTIRPTSAYLRTQRLPFRYQRPIISKLFSTTNSEQQETKQSLEDMMITCLNGAQDISVKVISSKHLLQQTIDRLALSQQVAQGYGELLSGALLMASNMKGEETLQVNLVGSNGVQNMIVVVDSQLRSKGKVGNGTFKLGNGEEKLSTLDLIGPGQLQVIKNHPVWKHPVNGIVAIRDVPLSINLALYMTESEQRLAAILSDIKIENGQCQYAVGITVERLPGATDENVETSIKNLEAVTKKGIGAYLTTKSGGFVDEEELQRIVDDCVFGMEKDSIRWSRTPSFHCSCGIDRVWNALRLLPASEITDIIESGTGVEMKCEFCGEKYNLSSQQVSTELRK